MKFDLHCHTKEGSVDSKVPVEEFAERFMSLGYDGFMISDHNSYRGCKEWDRIKHDPRYSDFTVIRGIEYDTKDAGHILVILPDDIYLTLLKSRGMRCHRLIHMVHRLGGILGPAHPYGAATSSLMGFKKINPHILNRMDFVEIFNTCELPEANHLADQLAQRYHLPGIGGSDSHVADYVGKAWTEIDAEITCNDDLIRAIKERAPITAGGEERIPTKRGKYKANWFGRNGYRIYNRGLGKLMSPRRGFHQFRMKRKKQED